MHSLPALMFYSDKPGVRVLRHLFLLGSMVLLFSWIVYLREDGSRTILEIGKSVALNALFFFSYAYLTAYLLVPFILSKKKYILFGLVFISAGLGISYVKFICSDYIFYTAIAADLGDRMRHVNFTQLIVNTKDMTFIVAIFLIAKYSKDNFRLRKRLVELRDLQIRSEISLLRNQLDPHVVFNNLNNLYALSLSSSDALEIHLRKLKSVLSYFFIEGKSKRVSLERELETIENYIALEKLRYGDRLSVNFQVEGDLKDKKIIPFVFFSFAENCIEHGCTAEFGEAWIKILIKSEARAVTFHASNSKPVNLLSSEEGHLFEEKTRKKLDMLYPGKYLLRIDDRKDMFCVDLKIKN